MRYKATTLIACRERVVAVRPDRASSHRDRRRPLPGTDASASLSGGAAKDRSYPMVCRHLRGAMAGTAELLGRGAEVWRARPLDWLGSSPPLRPLAPDRQSVAVLDPPPAPSPQPRLAGLVLMPAPNSIRLDRALWTFRCCCWRPSSTPSALSAPSTRRATGSMSAIPVAINAAAAANTARRLAEAGLRSAAAAQCPRLALSPTARMPVTTAVACDMKLSAEHMRALPAFFRLHPRPTPRPRPAPPAGQRAGDRHRRGAVRSARLQGHRRVGPGAQPPGAGAFSLPLAQWPTSVPFGQHPSRCTDARRSGTALDQALQQWSAHYGVRDPSLAIDGETLHNAIHEHTGQGCRIDRENLMATSTLWMHWYQAIAALRPAFSRQQTFLWFVVCVAGMSVRSDNLGVSSIVRALALNEPML